MLNSDGGIETDLTVVKIAENSFRIITAAANKERDKFHIQKHLSEDIKLLDVTEDEWAIRVACAQVIAADREKEKRQREAKSSRTY